MSRLWAPYQFREAMGAIAKTQHMGDLRRRKASLTSMLIVYGSYEQIWGGGHAVVLLTSLYCLVGVITFKPHPYAYKLAFSGALRASMCPCAACFID